MNKINYDTQTLSPAELSLVGGGHLKAKVPAAAAAIIAAAEVPHLLVGLTEFYNKVGARIEHGCSNIESEDYFSRHMCQAVGYVSGFFKGNSPKTEL